MSTNQARRFRRSACIAACLAAIATEAFPQDTSTADPEDGTGARLAEIVVTAQKREEDVSRVPISISVYDQQSMDQLGIRDLSDIAKIAPSVKLRIQGPRTLLSIRGIASTSGAAVAGLYIDDVPVHARLGTLNLTGSRAPQVFDLERVEVLRGPQGTHFGAGAQAGAIRFILPQPSLTERTGYFRSGVSGVDGGGVGYEAGLAVGGPITEDKLGYRVSAMHEKTPGYIDHYSRLPGGPRESDANWVETNTVRVALRYKPVERLQITPSVFFQDLHSNDLTAFEDRVSNPDKGLLINDFPLDTPQRDRLVVSSVKVDFDITPGISLTSITGYLDRDDTYTLDYTDVTPFLQLRLPRVTAIQDAIPVAYENVQKNVTQELRLQSSDPQARLKWTLGAWGSTARQEVNQAVSGPNLPSYVLTHTGRTFEQFFNGRSLLQPGNVFFLGQNILHDRQVAGFGQIDYELLDGLILTAGVRVSDNTSGFSILQDGPQRGRSFSRGEAEERIVTPRYGISYQITPSAMVYASAARGNRMGGGNAPFTNTGILTACLDALRAMGVSSHPDGYDSDFLWSYEVGSKNRLFNDSVYLAASAFYLEWEDLQQQIFVPACSTGFQANVGRARSRGFDLQLDARITDAWRFEAAVGYADAKIAETTGVPGGTTYVFNGDQIDQYQSPWTVTAGLTYTTHIAGAPTYFRIDDQFQSRNPGPFTFQRVGAASYNPTKPLDPSTNQINIRVGASINDSWDVSLFVDNVRNKLPVLHLYQVSAVAPMGRAFTLTPRTYGFNAIKHW